MKNNNKSGFSIIIALGLTLIMVFLVLYILEYIIPYSKNVKGIENSSNAFYQAEEAIEEGLYFFQGRSSIVTEGGSTFSGPMSSQFETTSSGVNIPPQSTGTVPGEGNSVFDKDFNQLSVGNSVNLDIGDDLDINWATTRVFFKVPDISSGVDERLHTDLDLESVITWQIISDDNALNAVGTGSLGNKIRGNDVCTGNDTSCTGINMSVKQGEDLYANISSQELFGTYYNNNCGIGSKCTLKFLITDRLELNNVSRSPIPYIEYKIEFGFNSPGSKVPLRYSRIKAKGKSYGFQKSLEIRVPQQKINEAFDFTVFQ